MKKTWWIVLFIWILIIDVKGHGANKKEIVELLELVNDRFMTRYPIPGDSIYMNEMRRPSNIWTRSVYMEGLLALNEVAPQPRYVEYAMDWAVAHLWGFRGGSHTRNADNQCCAQVYVDLYRLHGDVQVLGNTERMLNNVVNSTKRDDWWWIDALQMAMPVYAKMGVVKRDIRYIRTMMELYEHTRDKVGRVGLFNPVEGLWWRDADFLPPYKEPNGENSYWSRGNGWVLVALARTLEEMKMAEDIFSGKEQEELVEFEHRLARDFLTMAWALKECQRTDGFWNASLKDEYYYGGRETTGTSLFICGMAWGIRRGILSPQVFGGVVEKAWDAVSRNAVHPDGVLGYVQGTGRGPRDGQPVTYDSQPDFEDFGTGCFLLAGAEMVRLLSR